MHMKGFIGPIGDDIPTMFIIMLGLGMFFSSVVFAMDIYDQKNEKLQISEGALAVTKVFTSDGYFDESKLASDYGPKARAMADSYGLEYQVNYSNDAKKHPTSPKVCEDSDSYKYSFIIANFGMENNIDTLKVCVRRSTS